MKRYAAFLRGVTPMNLKMSELKAALEHGGFVDVKTHLSSGNVTFSARPTSESALERRAEDAMKQHLGRTFLTIVRSIDALRAMLASDPYAGCRLAKGSKRIVTFVRGKPQSRLDLPIEMDGARILCMKGSEAFSAYVRTPRGPVFMTLIEKNLGKDVTTRTWETVEKIAR